MGWMDYVATAVVVVLGSETGRYIYRQIFHGRERGESKEKDPRSEERPNEGDACQNLSAKNANGFLATSNETSHAGTPFPKERRETDIDTTRPRDLVAHQSMDERGVLQEERYSV